MAEEVRQMPRTDIHLDAMLRHLGAAYYESLHGRATRADVTRALDTVEDHLHESAERHAHVRAPSAGHGADDHHASREEPVLRLPGGWSRKVRDVMTTSVVTVDRITPYKEIARQLAVHRISGVPVLKMGRTVAGVVSEADLIRAQAATVGRLRRRGHHLLRARAPEHPSLTAGELMTAPAVTIAPDATVTAAARLMDQHQVRRLPVVDEHGKLLGIVSRRDLLGFFLRSDEDIADDVRHVLDAVLLSEPGKVDVAVHNGIVTLTGEASLADGLHGELIPLTVRVMWEVDGIVDLIDHLSQPPAHADLPGSGELPAAEQEETP
jgi:CBS domain-containing protein